LDGLAIADLEIFWLAVIS